MSLTHSAVWHPFTQHALEPAFKKIIKAQGAYLWDDAGNHYLDAISSWWVTTHGHCHPYIMRAIREASYQIDQIIFAEYTHEAAEKLAIALLDLTPGQLSYVFYSDSGSTAVEVAIKMALGFYKHQGISRTHIVVMEHSYHGDTVGAMSLGQRGIFNAAYEALLFDVKQIPFPAAGSEQKTLDAFEQFCSTNQVAAILIEPLILGAGGFKFYSIWMLRELKRIAKTYHVLFIVDEVMTGWGRTGCLFASEHAAIEPDILCTSKGLTGGALPLAATLCVDEIFQMHFSLDRSKTFFHSSSYTANPIACQAALANIDIWRQEPVFERIHFIETWHKQFLSQFTDHQYIKNIRQLGTIVAFDLALANDGYLSAIGPKLKSFFKQNHILLRPLGNVVYFMPPYCVERNELEWIYQTLAQAIEQLLKKPGDDSNIHNISHGGVGVW